MIPPPARGPQRLRNVLFVCLGNICRSPMAAALANRYGSDVLRATSAGLTPAVANSPLTRKVLAEKNVDLGDHMPRAIEDIDLSSMDLVVNMSGYQIPGVRTLDWNVGDPYGQQVGAYRTARDQIEMLVMQLILKIRTGKI